MFFPFYHDGRSMNLCDHPPQPEKQIPGEGGASKSLNASKDWSAGGPERSIARIAGQDRVKSFGTSLMRHPDGHLGTGTASDTVEVEVIDDFYCSVGILFAG